MQLNKYQYLLDELNELMLEYLEVRQKINDSGYPNNKLSDMPKGGNHDNIENLIDLIDTEIILLDEIRWLKIRIYRAKCELEDYITRIDDPQKRIIMCLRYIFGLTANEISQEMGKSYWSVIKILKRY